MLQRLTAVLQLPLKIAATPYYNYTIHLDRNLLDLQGA